MLHRAASNAYSWWWASHIRTKQSKWLDNNLQEVEVKVENILKQIDEDGDSFAQKADMYYRKRPELIKFVEEFFRAYRALAERYDHISGELHKANKTLATVFPDQLHQMSDGEETLASADKTLGTVFPEGDEEEDEREEEDEEEGGEKKRISRLPPPMPDSEPLSEVIMRSLEGLSKESAQQEIDKLLKGILIFQTEKEFIKSCYEGNLAKYWEIEKKMTEMQKEVCFLQDRYSVNMTIEDDEARALMAATALKTCEAALVNLQEQQKQSMEESRLASEKIKVSVGKLNSLKTNLNLEHEELSSSEPKVLGPLTVADERLELQTMCQKIKEHIEKASVEELAEKIDELAEKIIELEVKSTSQTCQIRRLRSEVDALEKNLQRLEEEKAEMAKLRDVEEELLQLQSLETSLKDESEQLLSDFSIACKSFNDLSERLQSGEESCAPVRHNTIEKEEQKEEEEEKEEEKQQEEEKVEEEEEQEEEQEKQEIGEKQQQEAEEKQEIEEKGEEEEEKVEQEEKQDKEQQLEEEGKQKIEEKEEEEEEKEGVNKALGSILYTDHSNSSPKQYSSSSSDGGKNQDEEEQEKEEGIPKKVESSPAKEDFWGAQIFKSHRGEEQRNQIPQPEEEEQLEEEHDTEREIFWQQMLMGARLEGREKLLLEAYTSILRNYKETKRKLLHMEKRHQKHVSETMAKIMELKQASAAKDEEIFSLRSKLHSLQYRKVAVREEKESSSPLATDEDRLDLRVPEEPGTSTATEQRFRRDIDGLLEENLKFWERFSDSFEQIQKLQDSWKKTQAEIAQPENATEATLKSLKSLKQELLSWLEENAQMKSELHSRFVSLAKIKEEMSRVLAESAGEEETQLTPYRATKFHGELLIMQQENNKVGEDLRAGLGTAKSIQAELERAMARLRRSLGVVSPAKTQPHYHFKHFAGKPKVPLKSFLLFGAKPKPKKPSLFSCMNPALQKQYSDLTPGMRP